jgi:hypothetical protein
MKHKVFGASIFPARGNAQICLAPFDVVAMLFIISKTR